MAEKKIPSLPIKSNRFPFSESGQLLFDFAENLVKEKKLDKVSAKQLESVLKDFRNVTEKKLDTFLIALTPHVRTTLKREYNRYFTQKTKIGIASYRLKDLAPLFRKELDNHVANSLALIKTQNEKTMLNLENVFRNWATVPAKQLRGDLTDPKKIITHLKKEVINDHDLKYKTAKHLKFILKDQTNKLNASMDTITDKQLDAIGFIWRTSQDNRVVGKPGGLYPVAENPKMHGNHYSREGKFYLYRDSWALKNGYIVPRDGAVYADTVEDGPPGTAIGCRCYKESVFDLEDIPSGYKGIITKKGQDFLKKE